MTQRPDDPHRDERPVTSGDAGAPRLDGGGASDTLLGGDAERIALALGHDAYHYSCLFALKCER
jgi:hypothetical protein